MCSSVVMKSNAWSIKDIRFMKANYNKMPVNEMCIAVNHSSSEVYSKAAALGLRRPSKTADIEQQKLRRLFDILRILHNERKTLNELSIIMEVGWRTVYRYLNLFEDLNIDIEKDFEGRYFIASDNCPLCNQQHITKL